MAETKVTKRQFDKAYNTYPPNKWVKFAYKHFSKETEKKDLKLSNTLVFILLGLFLVGFFGTVFNAPRALIGSVTITYSIILSVLVLYLFSAIFMNNRRLKKIAKLLGVDMKEYNRLATKFYG